LETKFLVIGAGAIGTYVGGSLALNGCPVVFLVRPETAGILERKGLRLELNHEEYRVKNPLIAASIEQALAHGLFHCAIFAIKSFDTESALETLAPWTAELPPFLCLQNGVENEARLAERLGTENVIAGTVTSSIRLQEPGDIVLERHRGLGVGGGHRISGSLVEAFNSAGLNALSYSDPAAMKWSKLLTNLLANATSAILDVSPAEVFGHSGLYRIEIEQLREVLQVMKAQGIPVVDLPGTPVRTLAFAARTLPAALSHFLLKKALAGGRGGKMPSFHMDLHSGRGQTEVDFLNGAVVRSGMRLGIPTPVNRTLTEILLALARGDLPLESFAHHPGRLLEEIQRRSSGNL
jgi:2-dehydropantoate 2-reductase